MTIRIEGISPGQFCQGCGDVSFFAVDPFFELRYIFAMNHPFLGGLIILSHLKIQDVSK